MRKKNINIGLFLIISILILSPLTTASYEQLSLWDRTTASYEQLSWWDRDWNFRQELIIPISTEDEIAHFQPIDMYVFFENRCWTINEVDTSIRVICWKNNRWFELESQIYNLDFSEENKYINGCNLIFLIPEFADGTEKYFIYYDDEKTISTDYPDHLTLLEASFHHEPIPGQKVETKFYAIKEEEFYVYYVAQEGFLIGQWMGQAIVKLENNTTEIKSEDAGHVASFSFSYYRSNNQDDISSTGQKLVSKEIIEDGNIMVKFKITSESFLGEIRTSNIYTYYFCPSEDKRIRIQVNHKALQESYVGKDVDFWDGSYASLYLFKCRSNSIKDLNFGSLLPYFQLYGKDDIIKSYYLNPNPNSGEPTLFLPASDECYLGKKAWVSFYNDEGITRSIMLSSNDDILQSGTDEKDGVQVRGFEVEFIDMPGLEADISAVHLMRNSYESGVYDRVIPSDFNVRFNAEYFTSNKGGCELVDKEAELFNKSINNNHNQYITDDASLESEEKRYNLTVYTHFAPSFPIGSFLSLITGKNFSYLSAELYEDNTPIAIGASSRIKSIPRVSLHAEDLNFIEIIGTYLSLIDLRNSTFLKNIKFDNLPEGRYIVKIFREHSPLIKEREFIGLCTVDLKGDTYTHIICKREGCIQVDIKDQNKNNLANTKVCVFLDDFLIDEDFTDENGELTFKLPYIKSTTEYKLKVFYDSFNVHEENFKLKYLRLNKPIKFSIEIPLYDINFRIVDSFGLPPDIILIPTLSSSETEEPKIIKATEIADNIFTFSNLYPSSYKLRINYKTFKVEKNLEIPSSKDLIDIEFPAEFDLKIHVFDSFGMDISNAKVNVNRNIINLEDKTNSRGLARFSLPPGEYTIKSFENEIKIMVTGDEEISFVTEKSPDVFFYLTVVSLFLIIIALAIFLWKKISLSIFTKMLVIVLLILALVMPWWYLNGTNHKASVEYNINIYPWSQKIVSKTTFEGNKYLELSTVPDIVNQFLMGVLLLTILCIFCIAVSIIFDILKKYKLEKIMAFGTIIILVVVILLFGYGIDQLSAVGIGSICGSDQISINIPYSAEYIDINASWCFSIGFYLCLISLLALIIPRVFIKKLYCNKQ